MGTLASYNTSPFYADLIGSLTFKITYECLFNEMSTKRTTFFHSVQTIFYTHCINFFSVFALLLPTNFQHNHLKIFTQFYSLDSFLSSSTITLTAFSVAGISANFFLTLLACVENEWEKKFALARFLSSLTFFHLILPVLTTAIRLKKFFV